jgi:hypothetical protein
MKRFAVFLTVVAFSFATIIFFGGAAPAPNEPQLGQVNIQTLMQNAHDLTDTTPAVPY